MFFPRVLPEGMFFDGLFYANIARDMVYGSGTFWHPHFFVTFWGEHIGNTTDFFGHPALAMWLLSGWYRIFGDHWFVEKAFCILVWCITVFLVIKIWTLDTGQWTMDNRQKANTQNPKSEIRNRKSDWWLPVFIWYCMPVVMWSYPYFILDNLMGVFSLGAAYLIMYEVLSMNYVHKKAIQDFKSMPFIVHRSSFIVLLHLAFLTKGPVGLYPLAIPFLFSLVYSKNLSVKKGFLMSFILSLITLASLCLWYFYPPAHLFWQNYFHTQIMSSLSQNEHTEVYSWRDYTLVLQNLAVSALPGIGVASILWCFSKIKNTAFNITEEDKKKSLFYFLVAMSGSLPMLVSHKTSWHYLIPCLPFLAMSFAAFFETTLNDWLEKFKLTENKSKKVNGFLVVLNMGVLVYCLTLIGTVAREKDLINDLKIFKSNIPRHTYIGVPLDMMNDFTYHAYFERYGDWVLQTPNDSLRFCLMLKNENKPDSLLVKKYSKLPLPSLKLFDVYVK